MRISLTTNEFIERAKLIHGDKYDYSKVVYKNGRTKIIIVCPIHGEFLQKPHDHLYGRGCPKCKSKRIKETLSDDRYTFIWKAIQKHGYKYDYRKVDYTNNRVKVCIICPEHGEFWQKPNSHLNGCGCAKCSHNVKLTTDVFIEKAIKIHGYKYDYSKVSYENNYTKVCIICPKHGEFWQLPSDHLRGFGCIKCSGLEKLTTKAFIERAKKVHKGKYDYSKVEYVNSDSKICIICPKHGEFWQTPHSHCSKNGCPLCANEINVYEQRLFSFLKEQNLNIEYQKRFKWLGKQSLDFYLPDYNIAIEYQGEQHFEPVKKYGGFDTLLKTMERDKRKYNSCNKNGIKIIYFTYNKKHPKEYIDKILDNEKELIDYIIKTR